MLKKDTLKLLETIKNKKNKENNLEDIIDNEILKIYKKNSSIILSSNQNVKLLRKYDLSFNNYFNKRNRLNNVHDISSLIFTLFFIFLSYLLSIKEFNFYFIIPFSICFITYNLFYKTKKYDLVKISSGNSIMSDVLFVEYKNTFDFINNNILLEINNIKDSNLIESKEILKKYIKKNSNKNRHFIYSSLLRNYNSCFLIEDKKIKNKD